MLGETGTCRRGGETRREATEGESGPEGPETKAGEGETALCATKGETECAARPEAGAGEGEMELYATEGKTIVQCAQKQQKQVDAQRCGLHWCVGEVPETEQKRSELQGQ